MRGKNIFTLVGFSLWEPAGLSGSGSSDLKEISSPCNKHNISDGTSLRSPVKVLQALRLISTFTSVLRYTLS